MTQIFIFLLFISATALAHPVIYKDGTALSSFNMPSYSENYLMHSYSTHWSTGLGHLRFTKGKRNTELGLVKLNHLLWRKNGEDYQSNLYLHGGVGIVDHEFSPRNTREAYFAGVEGDWETRTLYTSFKHYQFHTPAFMDLNMTQGRVGVSPKLSDAGDLQTWLMLQAMITPETDKSVILTPLVRFFYHNVMWEMGSSLRGEWMLNFMAHY